MTKKIIIIQLRPGIGDLCMFLPRCHEIANKHKDYELTILTKERTRAKYLLQHDPLIKNIQYLDTNGKKKDMTNLFKFFKNNKFQKVYSYQYGPKYLKYVFLSKITGVKEIFYYGVFKKKEGMVRRSILANEKWLDIKINDFIGKIYLQKKKRLPKKKIIKGIGASGDNKRWPTKRYIELIDNLSKYKDYKFLLAGGSGEKFIIKELINSLPKIKFQSLEKLNLMECMEEIQGALFFVGNDTGFMHVSACLNIKTFCLYGDTPSIDSEYNKNIIPILPPGKKIVYHDDLAMNEINVDLVLQNILNFNF